MRATRLILAVWSMAVGLAPTACVEEAASGSPAEASQGADAADDHCTWQRCEICDPSPRALECDKVADGIAWGANLKLCVIGRVAVFVAWNCGISPFCNIYGDWTHLEASVSPSFGAVRSAQVIDCVDRLGVEVVIDLAPSDGSSGTGALMLTGELRGLEGCHGNEISCPVAGSYELDTANGDCSGLERAYCQVSEAAPEIRSLLDPDAASPSP